MKEIKTNYYTQLPHIQPIGATFFVTFRLIDSLPKVVVSLLKDAYEKKISLLQKEKPEIFFTEKQTLRKAYFKVFETELDHTQYGNHWLKNPGVAQIVADKMHQYDNEYYELIAYCIMSNHVHLVISTHIQADEWEAFEKEDKEYMQLYDIMHRIKGGSAFKANKILGRKGAFWQKDSFDYYTRNKKELQNIIRYVLENPVKAGLVENARDWKFSYLKPEWEHQI